jgi:hypothetical protein
VAILQGYRVIRLHGRRFAKKVLQGNHLSDKLTPLP